MIEALKLGALLQKVAHGTRRPDGPQILRMATSAGPMRSIAPTWAPGAGYAGRLLPVRSAHPKSTPLHDPISTLVYTGGEPTW